MRYVKFTRKDTNSPIWLDAREVVTVESISEHPEAGAIITLKTVQVHVRETPKDVLRYLEESHRRTVPSIHVNIEASAIETELEGIALGLVESLREGLTAIAESVK